METSYCTLPLTGRAESGRCRGRNIIPGWSTELELFRQVSNECHKAWVAVGKQRQGEVHTNKLKSHAVRRAKRASKLHQAKGLCGAALANEKDELEGANWRS